MITTAERLLKDTCESMTTLDSNLGVEVCLPALYPNGEHVTVILNERGDDVLLHDGGFALQSISSMGFVLRNNALKHIAQHAALLGCSFENGRVLRRCNVTNVASAAMTVANVCLYAASQYNSMQPAKKDFAAVVREVLSQKLASKVIPHFKAFGASGAKYDVTAAISGKQESEPKAIIEAVATPKSVSGRFRHLYDIKGNSAYSKTERLAIYDNEEDFAHSDFILLQEVSNVVAFSDLTKRLEAYV